MATRDLGTPCPPVQPITPTPRAEAAHRLPLVARLTVAGLRCPHCATRIGNALRSHPSVLGATVDLERGKVDVLLDAARLSPDEIARVIRDSADGSPRHYEVVGVETS